MQIVQISNSIEYSLLKGFYNLIVWLVLIFDNINILYLLQQSIHPCWWGLEERVAARERYVLTITLTGSVGTSKWTFNWYQHGTIGTFRFTNVTQMQIKFYFTFSVLFLHFHNFFSVRSRHNCNADSYLFTQLQFYIFLYFVSPLVH